MPCNQRCSAGLCVAPTFEQAGVICALELHSLGICSPLGLKGANEDSMERSGSPIMWEGSRNARGVRHLEWEGADKA